MQGKRFNFFEICLFVVGTGFISFLLAGTPTIREADPKKEAGVVRKEYFWNRVKVREEMDTNRDRFTDIWRIYRGGKTFELKIDSNFDRWPDMWGEYGPEDVLKTYRVDFDFDGRVDLSRPYFFNRSTTLPRPTDVPEKK